MSAEIPFAPMLATPSDALPTGGDWVFEPKYDGVRIVAAIDGPQVAMLSRNGNDKTRQFPEVRDALSVLGRARRAARLGALVLDGELVASGSGRTLEGSRFEGVQGRMHARDAGTIAREAARAPARLVVFDCLLDGADVLLSAPWTERRAHLERALDSLPNDETIVQASAVTRTARDAQRLLARMRVAGAEGIIAKEAGSTYTPGRRSPQWRKLKLEHQQEFVIGGYTTGRTASRAPNVTGAESLGALLVGYYERGVFRYAGKVGTGFTRVVGRRLLAQLRADRRLDSPFADDADDPSARAELRNPGIRWVHPRLVAEVRFNEWTTGGRLRQPVFLGLREDKSAQDVGRETPSPVPSTDAVRAAVPAVEAQLTRVIESGGDGVLTLVGDAGVATLPVTNLSKTLIPAAASRSPGRALRGHGGAISKAALMRYYAEVAPVLLPAIADRPLVLRRFPDGIDAPAFYQQQAPAKVPVGVRVEETRDPDARAEPVRRFVGGDLATLLYLVQLGAISVDPWHGRLDATGHVLHADYAIIDLDPGPAAEFARVVDVARWTHDELEALGIHAIAKTSGATGIHIVAPLVEGTSAESARLLAELVATRVTARHPDATTIVRSVARRPSDAIYVDYLQNIRGKTVASVYSARARAGATVSTPLRWSEVTRRLDPTRFTIDTMSARLAKVGDLWGEAFEVRNDLSTLFD